MASLNTLRTKFGIVLSIIIGLALLAFILSLRTEMGFAGNDPKVGEINGKKVKYSDYYEVYEQIKSQTNATEETEQQQDELSDMAWQELIANRVYIPGFEKMGLLVTDAERKGLINGEYYSPIMSAAFTNPRTGLYDTEFISQFISQAAIDPQIGYAWSSLVERAMQERQFSKYTSLVEAGTYVNQLDIAQGLATADKTFKGAWVGKRYKDIPDSLFTVTDSEIKAYYDAHKSLYKQKPSRTLSYVVFEVAASDADKATLEQTVREVASQFEGAEDVRAFIRENRFGKIAPNFVSAIQIPDDMAEPLSAGKMYGPILKNDNWTIARVVESKMLPDSIGLRHIVLPYTQEQIADSLMTALRNGADFAQMARDYSVYMETASKGGDFGIVPFSAFPDEVSAQLETAKKGDLIKVVAGNSVQLIEPYYIGKPAKLMRLATITYPVEASSATRREIHANASKFAVSANGSIEAFNAAADENRMIPREAKLVEGDRSISGLENSRELVRWAYGAKEGVVSEIFSLGNNYVVAVVTDIDNDPYTSISKVKDKIRTELLNDKKFESVAAKMEGKTLKDIESLAAELDSQIVPFENVRYISFFVRDLGMEPRVTGAIGSTKQTGVLSKPIKGETGAFVFVVNEITDPETPRTPEEEQVRQQTGSQTLIQNKLSEYLEQMADVEDLRGKYF